jgi:hypothetical protein
VQVTEVSVTRDVVLPCMWSLVEESGAKDDLASDCGDGLEAFDLKDQDQEYCFVCEGRVNKSEKLISPLCPWKPDVHVCFRAQLRKVMFRRAHK